MDYRRKGKKSHKNNWYDFSKKHHGKCDPCDDRHHNKCDPCHNKCDPCKPCHKKCDPCMDEHDSCDECGSHGPCCCKTLYDKCGRKVKVCCATGPTGPTPVIPGFPVFPWFPGNNPDIDLCENPNAISRVLQEDLYANNLTICGKIFTNGYRIFVRDTLTLVDRLGDLAIICNDAGECYVPLFGTLSGGIPGGLENGKRGANTVSNGPGGSGSFPGGESTPVPPEAGGPNILATYPHSVSGRDLNGNLITSLGSGGGAGDVNNVGGNSSGPIIILANKIAGTGTISSRGGTPRASSTLPVGGGSSSFIVLNYYEDLGANYTIDVSGGSGRNGGTNGSPGVFYNNKWT